MRISVPDEDVPGSAQQCTGLTGGMMRTKAFGEIRRGKQKNEILWSKKLKKI